MEKYNKKCIHILGLYHPPQNAANHTTNGMLLDDLRDLLMEKIPKLSNTIIMGASISIQRMYPMLIQLSSMIQCKHWA